MNEGLGELRVSKTLFYFVAELAYSQTQKEKIFSLTKEINMKIYRILCILFVIAAFCFLAGTVNHIVNTHEGWLSSLLLAGGCLCGAFIFYKKK